MKMKETIKGERGETVSEIFTDVSFWQWIKWKIGALVGKHWFWNCVGFAGCLSLGMALPNKALPIIGGGLGVALLTLATIRQNDIYHKR